METNPLPELPPHLSHITPELLNSIGFDKSEHANAMQMVLDGLGAEAKEIELIDVGTAALDCDEEGDYVTDGKVSIPCMGGLGLVDNKNKIIGSEEESLPDTPHTVMKKGHGGGVLNAANLLGQLQENEALERCETVQSLQQTTAYQTNAVMFLTGRDKAGEVYCRLVHPQVDDRLTRRVATGASGFSVVKTQRGEHPGVVADGQRAIYFRLGVNDQLKLDKWDILEIIALKPKLVNISYPALIGANTEQLAWFTKKLSEHGIIATLDTHDNTEMEHIKNALPNIGMLHMNLTEADKIFCDGKEKVNEDQITPEQKEEYYRQIEAQIKLKFMTGDSTTPRLALVTDKEGCLVVFRDNQQTKSCYIESPTRTIAPGKGTKRGAGDATFAVPRAVVARREKYDQAWSKGSFSWNDAVELGHLACLTGTLQVQGKESNSFAGVTLGKLQRMAQRFMKGEGKYHKIEPLLGALRAA